MTHFSPISVPDLQIEHLFWLDKAAKGYYYGETLQGLLRSAVAHRLQLWTVEDSKAKGMVGTSISQHKDRQELWIEFLVGEGFLVSAEEIHQAFKTIAKSYGCSWISGTAIRPGLARLYERVLGVNPRAQIFTEELSDGTEERN